WAIAVMFSSAKSSGSIVYQISGTYTDYALATPASVTLSSPPNSQGIVPGYRYITKTAIGLADIEKLATLHSTLRDITIVHGDLAWGTHEWVLQGIEALGKLEGFFVESHVSAQWIKEQFGEM
ncbi:hypothetical protein SCLCIDRAFT_137841, partial [Scleroderma citrinum Foug A]